MCCASGDSTIHEQGLPGHITAGLGGQEHDCGIEIMRLAWSFQRNAVAEIIDPLFILVKNSVLFRAKPARGQAIDSYPMFTRSEERRVGKEIILRVRRV